MSTSGSPEKAFNDAAEQVQPQPASSVWGDERMGVAVALHWASTYVAQGSDPKSTVRSADALEAAAGQTITPEGMGAAQALHLFDTVLRPATRSADDPMNLAYIPSAPTRLAVAFDAVVSSANIYGGLWEGGAGAIFAENQVLRWLADLLGWPEGARGVFVSGGTSGNLSALAAARGRAKQRRGGRPGKGWALLCADTAHSSIISSARVLDVDVVTAPVDGRGHLTGAAVEKALAEHDNIFAVVVSGGTTNAGIVDDIGDVVKAAHAQDVWVHVDGAYGGAALAAPSVRERFAGIEETDSFIVDPHKWLFAPYDCCALVYREPEWAAAEHSQHAAYLEQIDRGESNPSDLAAHLSRRVRGLPLWYSLASHGTQAYSRAVERGLSAARRVADALRESEHFELVMEPELSVVMFRRVGWDEAAYARWSRRLALSGQMLCVPTRYEGEMVLRLAFVNPDTDPEKVIDLLLSTTRRDDGS